MSLSISGIAPVQPTYTPASTPAATGRAVQPTASADTVKLSQSAQVSQLTAQGQSPSQIADTLGLPVATVDSDLGIVAAKVSSDSAKASAPTAPPPTAAAAPAASGPGPASTVAKSALA